MCWANKQELTGRRRIAATFVTRVTLANHWQTMWYLMLSKLEFCKFPDKLVHLRSALATKLSNSTWMHIKSYTDNANANNSNMHSVYSNSALSQVNLVWEFEVFNWTFDFEFEQKFTNYENLIMIQQISLHWIKNLNFVEWLQIPR